MSTSKVALTQPIESDVLTTISGEILSARNAFELIELLEYGVARQGAARFLSSPDSVRQDLMNAIGAHLKELANFVTSSSIGLRCSHEQSPP